MFCKKYSGNSVQDKEYMLYNVLQEIREQKRPR